MNLLFDMYGIKELVSTSSNKDLIDSIKDVDDDLIQLAPPISLADWSCGATVWLAALHQRVTESLKTQLEADLSKMGAAWGHVGDLSDADLAMMSLEMQSGSRNIRFLAAHIWVTRMIDNQSSERQALDWCATFSAQIQNLGEEPGMSKFMATNMDSLAMIAESAEAHIEAGGSRPALQQSGALCAEWDGKCAWVTMQLDAESSVRQPFQFELPSQPHGMIWGVRGNDAVAAQTTRTGSSFRRAIFTELQPSRPGVLASITRPGSGSLFMTHLSLRLLGGRRVIMPPLSTTASASSLLHSASSFSDAAAFSSISACSASHSSACVTANCSARCSLSFVG